ncbi:hypothetical protein BDB01DRAFT_847738 [Pilobolus umbonatus]|nr:hypothetical protein BDB01DRAFT_847738 [Pilobolus umbonatus]
MDNFSLLATNDELFNDPARSIEFEWTISRAPNRIYDEPLTPRLLLYPPQNEDSILGYNFKEDSLLNKMYYNSKILLHNSVLTLGFQNELYREIKKNDSSAILGVKPDFIEYSSVNVYEVTNIGGLPPNSTLNEISGTFYLEAFDLSMKIREEVKQHTVIATIGLAGGGYSTLTAVYILIFGTSRLTPWGLFHLFHRLFVRRRLKFKEDESLAYFTWNTSEATRRDMTLVDKQEDRNRLWLLKNPFSKSRTESAETIQQLGNEDVSRDTSIMVGKIKHENIERRNVMLTQDSSHSNDLQTQINDLLEERKEEINTVKALSQRVNELEYMLKAYYIDSSYLDEMGFKGSFDVISSTNKEV